MTGLEAVGRWLVIAGVVLAVVGGLVWLASRFFPNLSQIPGTIRMPGRHSRNSTGAFFSTTTGRAKRISCSTRRRASGRGSNSPLNGQ